MMTVKVFFMDKLFCIHTDINRMPLFPLIYNSIIIYECLSLLESFWQSRETLPFPPLLSPQINPIYPYPDHKVNPKQPTPLAPSLPSSPPLKESHRIHFPGTNEETVWIINTYQPFIYDYYGQDTAAAVIAASAAITTSAGKTAAVITQIPAGKYVSNFI